MISDSWTRENLAWLAGLLEGEGSFTADKNGRQPRVKVKMTDEDVVRRAAQISGVGRVYGPYKAYKPSGEGRAKDQWVWVCQRACEAYAVMVAVAPWLLSRRRAQVCDVITQWVEHVDARGKNQNGPRNPRALLTEDKVQQIRSVYDGKRFLPGQAAGLSQRLGCSRHTVWEVATGRTYR